MFIGDIISTLILGLATYFIHVLTKYNEAKNKSARTSTVELTFANYVINNWTRLLISLLAYLTLWMFCYKLKNISMTLGPISLDKVGFMYCIAFLGGYMSDSLFRNIIKIIQSAFEKATH